jgi:nucleotide-binding universal stress UspA family protein
MIPIDGSPFSEQALPVALSLARAAGAALRLVGVHDFNPAVYACAESTVVFDVDESVLDAEQQHLKALAATWASRSNLPCTATVVTHAAAAEGLLQEARALRPDLLVVATHGRGPLSRAWLGSVAQELITQASSPVLVVRPRGGEVDLKAEPAFRHVLVPLDGSPQSELVVESALALGAPFQEE